MNPADIFDLLAVPRREDSYSSVIVHALRASSAFRARLLEFGFPGRAPELQSVEVELRRGLGSGIVDILVTGIDRDRHRWVLFIENKIDASESRGQTSEYLRAARKKASDSTHASGIFLTLAGTPASAEQVHPYTHRKLAGDLEATLDDYPTDSPLRIAVEAYIARARAPWPEATGDITVGDLLATSSGLIPWYAGAEALGQAIAKRAGREWKSKVVWIQGRGHANPGLLFSLPGWSGPELQTWDWSAKHLDVHLEVELVDGDPGPIRVHFETSPYLTKREIERLSNREDFYDARRTFQQVLHDRARSLPGWQMTRRHLQAARCDPDLDACATVKEVVNAYAKQIVAIGNDVDTALKEVHKALRVT